MTSHVSLTSSSCTGLPPMRVRGGNSIRHLPYAARYNVAVEGGAPPLPRMPRDPLVVVWRGSLVRPSGLLPNKQNITKQKQQQTNTNTNRAMLRMEARLYPAPRLHGLLSPTGSAWTREPTHSTFHHPRADVVIIRFIEYCFVVSPITAVR